tara:strand:- start:440 stop:562 length:123 start_codon:yes stop_codon:yes gene_type:complete
MKCDCEGRAYELTTGYYAWEDDGEGQIMMYIEDEMNTDSA